MTAHRPPTPEQIKQARKQAGFTQKQAAELVHASSYRTWQDWERGERNMGGAEWELFLIKTDQTNRFDVTKT